MKVSFCEHNPHKTVVIDLLKANYPEIEITIKDCINNCGACSIMPIASADGRALIDDNAEELYMKIISLMK